MRFSYLLSLAAAIISVNAGTQKSVTTAGLTSLLQRRLPNHVHFFEFNLVSSNQFPGSAFNSTSLNSTTFNDCYSVTSVHDKVVVEGNSLSALSSGLHAYLKLLHVDIYWYIGSQLHHAPAQFPALSSPLSGCSIVPWRYHFNTVTFSYTTAFWDWDDWELELDWLALRGVNLPLAWVGVEQIILDVLRDVGMTDSEIFPLFSGPAFQSWNRFGNIKNSWGAELPVSWISSQFALQKKIVARMVELGMTPVLPAFTGFVPEAFTKVFPNASTINGSQWEGFPAHYTNTTFLQPEDPLFTTLQIDFISKQTAAYGNVSTFFTLDQYNENNPSSGDLDYLSNVTSHTWKSLKAADPSAIWVMQGWLFYSNIAFWTNDRIEAYLGGVPVNSDMLILDLFSESQPQWQRTNGYFGKGWLWCQLHNYGGNQGLYGQLSITIDSITALANASNLLGFGLTMEGQEQGNEIMYDLLLDQAWSATPINTQTYFHDWVSSRYSGCTLPPSLYTAWELLRTSAYNNTNLTSNAVTKSIFELIPSLTGLVNRTGHHPTTINYNTSVIVEAWEQFYSASKTQPALWENSAYQFDLVDITRQVIANGFITIYNNLTTIYHKNNTSTPSVVASGNQLIELLEDLDKVLATNPSFLLGTWITSARSWASEGGSPQAGLTGATPLPPTNTSLTSIADLYEYNARNQVTLWGPTGQISDYASKTWAGLVSGYYVPRWKIFIKMLTSDTYNTTVLSRELLAFEEGWQLEKWDGGCGTTGGLENVLETVVGKWSAIFTV